MMGKEQLAGSQRGEPGSGSPVTNEKPVARPTAPQPASLLLEVGTEEIPARFIPSALALLRDKAGSFLNEYSVDFSVLRTYGTPRRLVLLAEGIPPLQRDSVKEVFGPPRKAAFDAEGKPTRAATGFAASQGVEVSDLVIRSKDKGEYVVAVIEKRGVAVREVLPEVLEKTVRSLHFPKSMRWAEGEFRFVRPVRWIVALYGAEPISFEIDGIRSGNISKGHRFLSPGSFAIKDIATYIHLMENNFVIVDQETRKKAISEGITRLASTVGGVPVMDEELLETVTYLTEYPVPFLCKFPSDYLKLPTELLVTVMRDHQKFFAVEDEQARLKNYFIVVGNTKEENEDTIRTGAERVIKARFEDARFYYEEDLKKPLHTRIEDLKRVTFHDRLGSLYDKTARTVKLASFLAGRLFPGKKANVERAAWLSKTDLLSGVVGEFPELQGLMGKYYALNDGEGRAVAEAIHEQYLPARSGDRLPETDEGSVVSIADKVDNIMSFFAIGLAPTGSEDPFALRRQALAVMAILMDKGYPLTLKEVFREAEGNVREARPSLAGEVLQFFLQRAEPLFLSQGFAADVIQSVLHIMGDVPPAEVRERLLAITKFTGESEYNGFLLALKRINNIVPDVGLPAFERRLLIEPQEKTLWGEVLNVSPAFREIVREKKYFNAMKLLATLTEPINQFFDSVLVMDKREDVKLNRFALLKGIWDMTLSIADFSKLAER